MNTKLAIGAALLAVGYVIGRYRPGHRASQWAAWQSVGKRPTGWRFVATWTVLSAENIGWLLAHPIKGVDAWKHRNDPPPGRSPAVAIPVRDPDWAAKRAARSDEEAR